MQRGTDISRRTVALLLSALVLTGCTGSDEPAPQQTGPVDVPVPPAPAPARAGVPVEAACQALTQALPQSVADGVDRRPVLGAPDRTAAWGDPVVTLTCGTSAPAVGGVDGALFALGLPGSTCVGDAPDPRQCLSVLQKDLGSANLFTTYERAVQVQVLVPDRYDTQVLIRMLPALVTLPAG